jgi:Phosphatidyl serine synthase
VGTAGHRFRRLFRSEVSLRTATIFYFVGPQTVEWAKAQDYNWSGLSQQPSLTAKAKRSLLQFTPYSWDDFQWRASSTPKRCIQSLGLLTVFLLMEVRVPSWQRMLLTVCCASAQGLAAGAVGYV